MFIIRQFFFNLAMCIAVQYLSVTVNCLMIYALTMITINRYFTITHPNKRLFETHAWSFISLGVQWMIAIVLPITSFRYLF